MGHLTYIVLVPERWAYDVVVVPKRLRGRHLM